LAGSVIWIRVWLIHGFVNNTLKRKRIYREREVQGNTQHKDISRVAGTILKSAAEELGNVTTIVALIRGRKALFFFT